MSAWLWQPLWVAQDRRGVVTWVEFETPDAPATDRRGIITWLEFQIPDVVVVGAAPPPGSGFPRKRGQGASGKMGLFGRIIFERNDQSSLPIKQIFDDDPEEDQTKWLNEID